MASTSLSGTFARTSSCAGLCGARVPERRSLLQSTSSGGAARLRPAKRGLWLLRSSFHNEPLSTVQKRYRLYLNMGTIVHLFDGHDSAGWQHRYLGKEITVNGVHLRPIERDRADGMTQTFRRKGNSV